MGINHRLLTEGIILTVSFTCLSRFTEQIYFFRINPEKTGRCRVEQGAWRGRLLKGRSAPVPN